MDLEATDMDHELRLHIDIVKNDWDQEMQVRKGTLSFLASSDPLPVSTVVRMLSAMAEKYDGPYAFCDGPHAESECPFRDSDRLPMVRVPVKGQQTTT